MNKHEGEPWVRGVIRYEVEYEGYADEFRAIHESMRGALHEKGLAPEGARLRFIEEYELIGKKPGDEEQPG